MTGYVGGYLKCLMTQGELPALGVSDGDLSKHTGAGYKCSATLEKTNTAQDAGGGTKNLGTTTQLSSTKPVGSTKDTASSRGVGSSSSSKKNSSTKQRRKASNDSSDDDDTKFSSNVRNRSEAYSSSDSEGDDSVRTSPIPKKDLVSEASGVGRPVSGELNDALKKKTRGGGVNGRETRSQKVALSPDEELRPGPRRSTLKPPQRNVAAAVDEAETQMGFGYFLKWLMIAGIGIALFIFFGGQIMNYNNSEN